MHGGIKKEFLDLGRHPIANAFLKEEDFDDEFFFKNYYYSRCRPSTKL